MDWSTLKVVDLIEVKRMSAGTLSPTKKETKTCCWMEINPVLEVNKAKQNNTVMTFQIYKNGNKKARTLQKKGTSKAIPMTAKVPLHFQTIFKSHSVKLKPWTTKKAPLQSQVSVWHLMAWQLTIMDCAFKGWNESQKYVTHLKRKQHNHVIMGWMGLHFNTFFQKPFKAHLLSS